MSRQVSLNLSTASTLIRGDALEALVKRQVIQLSPHPEVELGSSVNWYMDPLGERNWCAQLHMFRWLRPLVDDVKKNSNYESAQLIGSYIRSWAESAFPIVESPKYCWSDMIDAVRALEFLSVYSVVNTEDKEFIEELLYVHGEWLSDPKNLGHSNHAVWQHVALFVLGHAFSEAAWIETSKERIAAAFSFEYDDQGINREAAPGYHLYNFVLWQDVYARMAAEGDDIQGLFEKLDLARKALIQFTWPDGNLIELGDTGPRTHLKKLAGSDDIEYVLTKGAEGEIPAEVFSTYSAGYAFGRSGWGANAKDYKDEFFWALRFGSIGVHGHNDLGSLLLGASGQRLLIDAGKYAYLSDEKKKHIIGRSAHNTLVVEGAVAKEDAEYKQLSSYHSTTLDDIQVQGFPYQGVRHTRRVIYVRGADAILVFDNVASKKEHDYHLYWHLNPSATTSDHLRTTHIKIGRAKFSISELGTTSRSKIVRGVVSPKMEGWYSPKWAELDPTPTLKMTKSGGRLRFVTVIASDDKNKFEAESLPSGSNQFVLTTAHGYYAVDASVNPAVVSFSRGNKPKTAVKSRYDIGKLNAIAAEIDANSHLFKTNLGSRIRRRIESYTSENSSIGGNIKGAIALCSGYTTKDYGLRAAVIDAVAYGLGENHPFIAELQESDQGFRNPIFWDQIENPEATTGVFETKLDSNNNFNGCAVEGRHVLPWVGKKGNRTLIVRFNGAIDRSKVSLPYFAGFTSLSSRDESLLVFSDPAFDMNQDLTLGWYLGETPDGTLVYDWINRVIDEYVDKWRIEKVVLFGTSGGGYTSLQVGLRRNGARIVPINPQTVLANYFEQFYVRGRDSAFEDGKAAERRYPESFDTRLLLNQNSSEAIIHYVDNAKGDKHHHRFHYLPFAEAAERCNKSMKYIEVDLGNGHKSIDSDQVHKLLDEIIES